MYGKFSLCSAKSLNVCRNFNFLNFIGKLCHKSLLLKFDEFIPYFWVFTFGIERKVLLLREYRIFFSLYVFHVKLGSRLFLDLYILMARSCKCLWWVFSLLSKAKSSSYVVMQLLIKFYIYCTFSTLCISIFRQNIQINRQ